MLIHKQIYLFNNHIIFYILDDFLNFFLFVTCSYPFTKFIVFHPDSIYAWICLRRDITTISLEFNKYYSKNIKTQ